MRARLKGIIASVLALAGCGSIYYRDQPPGRFSGSLVVMWVGEGGPSGDGKFVFVPRPGAPLTFTRPNGNQPATVIKPGIMYTDGGSVPRGAQIFKGLSPWGYAPAYMIHDWLFEARHCLLDGERNPRFDGLEDVTFEDSAKILGEAIQALIVQNKVDRNDLAGNAITSAVSGAFAKKVWNEQGACARGHISEEHRAEIDAAFPEVAPEEKDRVFRTPPAPPRIAGARPGRIISAIDF